MSSPNFPFVSFPTKLNAPPPDGGAFCFSVDKKWIPYLLGAIFPLLSERTWIEADAEGAIDDAKTLLADIMTGGDCGMDCSDISFSIDGSGHLHFICSGTDTDLGSIVGPPGAPGTPGSGSTTPPPPPQNTGDVNGQYCGVAVAMQAWLHDEYTTQIETISAQVSAGKSFADTFIAVINSLPDTNINMDGVSNFIDDVITITTDTALANWNSTFEDWLTCEMYCTMKTQGSPVFTQNVWDDLLNKLPSQPATGFGLAVSHMLETFGPTALYRRSYIYQKEVDSVCDGLCTECGWCYKLEGDALHTFLDTDNTNPYQWVTDRAKSIVSGSPAGNYLYVGGIMPAVATITHVEFHGSIPGGTIRAWGGPNGTGAQLFTTTGSTVWDGAQTGASEVLYSTQSADPDNSYVDYIIIRGIGANPWGSDNCT